MKQITSPTLKSLIILLLIISVFSCHKKDSTNPKSNLLIQVDTLKDINNPDQGSNKVTGCTVNLGLSPGSVFHGPYLTTGTTDNSGTFDCGQLDPGTYYLYAIDTINNIVYHGGGQIQFEKGGDIITETVFIGNDK